MKNTALIVIFSMVPVLGMAADADSQAKSFFEIYSICSKNLSKLPMLNAKLAALPKLPNEKASFFLADQKGSAWPVPDKNGTFVLALHENMKICSAFAKEVDSDLAITAFEDFFSKAPSPMVVVKAKDEKKFDAKNGNQRTISYEWQIPDSGIAFQYTLTTASASTANLQGMFSAAIMSQK